MKNSIKFYAPMWLLMLITSFGLFSCNSEDITTNNDLIDPNIPSNTSGMGFVITDLMYNNLIKDKDNSIYDIEYMYIITADGKYKDDLTEHFIERSNSPIWEGWHFRSSLLDQISSSVNYDKSLWKTEYADKPLYLILSPEDTDTLLWNTKEKQIYHNGKPINKYHAILKDVKN